jgi:cytochrome P450
MEIHSVQEQTIQGQIEKLMQQQIKREIPVPFSDPIREFAKASQVEGMVRNWLTYPIEERRRLVKNAFAFIPRFLGDEREGKAPETDQAYEKRQQERWRALCVIIQEESRAKPGNRAPEVAIGALKHLFPDYDWKAKSPETPPLK